MISTVLRYTTGPILACLIIATMALVTAQGLVVQWLEKRGL